MKQKQKPSKLRNLGTPLLAVACSLLVAAAIIMGCFVHAMWERQQTDTVTIRGLIRDAVTNLYQPAVVSPRENLQYAYEAKVDFPLSSVGQNQNFRYSYAAEGPGVQHAQLDLTTNTVLTADYSQLYVSTQHDFFKNVPQYQRCSKEFFVRFDASDPGETGFTRVSYVPLHDGRVAYLYQNTGCSGFYRSKGVTVDDNLATLKAIQSY
ncbi:MAG TPA: hypothetical protein VLF71_05355 [Candidatus Saccharimonadales bacterium]|nr:hypothetical protein [Candidatus Saccharimonadales bacterium]